MATVAPTVSMFTMIRMRGVSIVAIRTMVSRARLRLAASIATDTETASAFGVAISRAARVARSRRMAIMSSKKGATS